jgi:putative CocE/NonD family hydrolase
VKMICLVPAALIALGSLPAAAQNPLPSETPAKYAPVRTAFDHDRREVMIAMRDGVKLHTVILVPKGARRAPMLLTRTPYDANATTTYAQSSHLAPALNGYDNALDVIIPGGYIRVVQDVRGKYGSEGDYVMNRPLRGPLNPTQVDESTDTYDTIDWLVKNVAESNGKVGEIGISYDGFEPLMGIINSHPALKVAVPMNPMVDGWMGDDWFHYGAFRQQNMPYILEQEATRDNSAKWWTDHADDYDQYMSAGSAGELGKRHGLEQVGFWNKILQHPSYDSWWQLQAMDKVLAEHPPTIPVMLVHSLWDAEDIYGALAVYKKLSAMPQVNDNLYLVLGPWHHGQGIENGSSLGAIDWDENTSREFQRFFLAPFLAHFLRDSAPPMNLAKVTAYLTGINGWRRLGSWPSGCEVGCTIQSKPLYLHAGFTASFTAPSAGGAGAVTPSPSVAGAASRAGSARDLHFDSYISDPAKPVPYRKRPIQSVGYENEYRWPSWLVDDQREASGRTDVLTYQSEVLTETVHIAGQPIANIVASTTGTDADWVVKVIDVYPDEVGSSPKMGGYQLPVSMDIFRGRYRESFETPKAIAPNAPLLYKFALPAANHVFLAGHRIMIQIQSSWFPLYDRNPQTFVPNIFWAKPSDYQKAEHRVYRDAAHASFVDLPVVERVSTPR